MRHQSLPRLRRATTRVAALATPLALVMTGLVGPVAKPRPVIESRTLDVTVSRSATTVTSPLPAEMVGLTWAAGTADATVDVRAKRGGRWTSWQSVAANPDEGPDTSSHEYSRRVSAGPIWLGHGVRDLEIKLESGASTSVRLTAIHTTDGANSPAAVTNAEAFPAQPQIYTRADWGADETWRTHNAGCDNPDYAPTVHNAFIHHTVSDNTYAAADVPSMIRGFYYFHVFTNGWCDIGYNFLVDRFGRAWEGRYGGITKAVIGAHTGGFNTGSTGIALIGNFDTGSVSSAMYGALRDLLAWKLAYHSVDPMGTVQATSGGAGSKYPAGTVVTLSTISGHRDVWQTACPGDNAYPLLGRLRSDVQASILATPPYPLPGWVPASGAPKLLTLSGYGGVAPAGGAAAVTQTAYWPGWSIARGLTAQTGGGYVVDGWGGLHPFGNATGASGPYWSGWDIARGVASTGLNRGYVLDGWGGVHPYGTAVPTVVSSYWSGWDIARGLVTNTANGGYVLDGWGGLHPFGVAPTVASTAYWQGWDIARGLVLRSDGASGYVLDGWGGIHPFGGAPEVSVSHYVAGQDWARGIALDPDGLGGYVVDRDGLVWPFGNATAVATAQTWIGRGVGRGLVEAP